MASKPSGAEEGYLRTGLGEALLNQGRFSEAAKELKRAYSIIDKTQPATSDLRARVLDDMAWISQTQNDRSSAIAYCKQALAALQGVPNADPAHLLEMYEHLGSLTREEGLYQQAANYYRQALALAIKAQGESSLQVADYKERLAMMLRNLGDANQARNLYAQALQVKSASAALFQQYAPHIYTQTVVYRYNNGVPNCSMQGGRGTSQEVISVDGVTIGASLAAPSKDLGKNACVSVSILNDSQTPIQLMPKPPIMIALAPKVVIGHLVDSAALANQVQKKGEKSAKWVRFWGADSTQPVTTTFIGNPGVWGYPPVTSYNGIAPMVNRSGNMTTVTTQVPDYLASMRALQKAANIEDRSRNQANAIRSNSLTATTVGAGRSTSGT
ncbi:MAG: tetratricopeptide repeat protein, partial [Terriglobales bacterium]